MSYADLYCRRNIHLHLWGVSKSRITRRYERSLSDDGVDYASYRPRSCELAILADDEDALPGRVTCLLRVSGDVGRGDHYSFAFTSEGVVVTCSTELSAKLEWVEIA